MMLNHSSSSHIIARPPTLEAAIARTRQLFSLPVDETIYLSTQLFTDTSAEVLTDAWDLEPVNANGKEFRVSSRKPSPPTPLQAPIPVPNGSGNGQKRKARSSNAAGRAVKQKKLGETSKGKEGGQEVAKRIKKEEDS
ncbi:MFS drug transporter [Pseudohyphozyma bogoriensis]|nr:MFS drug transporter [Pseudohyphozyma bogoriensis]